MYNSEVKKLINLIKERKTLYDYNDKQYSNRTAIDTIWMEIALQMNIEASECKKKWICLRNSYARYLRELRTSDMCGKQRKQWYMADAMSFLKEYVNLHPSKIRQLSNANAMNPDDESQSSPSDSSMSSPKNSPVPSKNMNTSEIPIIEIEDELIMKCEPSLEYTKTEDRRLYEPELVEGQDNQYAKPKFRKRTRSNKQPMTKRRKKIQTKFTHTKTRTRVPSQPPKEAIRKESVENGDDLFFKSLLVDYENLSRRNQRIFRMHMLEKMNELQEEEESE